MMSRGKITRNETVEQAKRFVRNSGAGFADQGEIIEAIALLVGLRTSLLEPAE